MAGDLLADPLGDLRDGRSGLDGDFEVDDDMGAGDADRGVGSSDRPGPGYPCGGLGAAAPEGLRDSSRTPAITVQEFRGGADAFSGEGVPRGPEGAC